MVRIGPPVVALLLFVGAGFAIRTYFPQWLDGKLKESQAATAKEFGNFKPVETNFTNLKFDQPLITTPTFTPPQATFNPPPSIPHHHNGPVR
jgi:hypothetical protein